MGLKETLQHDLTESMRAKDEIVMATIRLALTAITNEEVAGKEAKTLDTFKYNMFCENTRAKDKK